MLRTCCLLGVAVLATLGACAAYAEDNFAGVVEVIEEARASSEPRRKPHVTLERPAAEPEPSTRGWALAVGGQLRLRGDFTRNQNLTDFSFTHASGSRRSLNAAASMSPLRTLGSG